MEITIFAKKRTTRDGKKSFYSYLTTLTSKDGTPCSCSVRFTAPAEGPDPLECPCNILVEKSDCNMSFEKYTDDKTGEIRESRKLWIRAYKNGAAYVDHSMDDFM